jgi:acyl dehydratase
MAIDPEKLLAFAIPKGRQMLTARDAALYALSVGFGCDPLDREQLHYVDPLHGPTISPTMVLVIAHPGFWLADPNSGVDPTAVLHASQSFAITASIPKAGPVESATRITELIDKGPGKAALLVTETELTQENGIVFARLERTTFIRGGGGFGGSAQSCTASEAQAAPEAPVHEVIDIHTRPEQALLYRLNGDLNPLHSDPDAAAKTGFRRPILHGLCTMGVIGHALLRALAGYRAERLCFMSLRFCNPVFPGETIRTEIWKNGQFRAHAVERDILVADQGCAHVGEPAGQIAAECVN